MISRIKIYNIPPYLGGEQTIEAKHINFLFGHNGSGKTTISRFMRAPELPIYNHCSIDWNGTPLKCEVYNRDYVKDNFSESTIPGIFTLGEENIELQSQIEALTAKIKNLEERLLSAEKELNGTDESDGLQTQLRTLSSTYTDKFWAIKQKLDKENSSLKYAIEGSRGSKDTFRQKILSEYATNQTELLEKNELERFCNQLFASDIEKVPNLLVPSFDNLIACEDSELLGKVIVGKESLDIAGLIKKLGSDRWFRQGVPYLEMSNGLCPFCQKPLDVDFLAKVDEYFDETYRLALNDISRLNDDYTLASSRLIDSLNEVVKSDSKFLKTEELQIAVLQLQAVIENNKRKLLDKKDAPNTIIQLESIRDISEAVRLLFLQANKDIAAYNERIDHIKDEKEALTSKVWRYILHILNNDIEEFLKGKKALNHSIETAKVEIEALKKEIDEETQNRRSLEQRLTSILPTANGINALLQNYGVTGFSLKVDDSGKSYQFIRENGTPAYESLSEGERSFVTFLYFMYSLKGNRDESGHNDDKVVVIDDPVSSLDNDVLFLVSSLLRDLFKDVYAGTGTIKQLFILSHNSYFYKEVSYKQGIANKKTGYWMITKSNNISTITSYTDNPVSSTYEMLWNEVRAANLAPIKYNTASLANTMRRIIEHYFNLLGGMDLSQFHLEFPEGERQVFKSLISWANAGSHSAFDDYSATPHMCNTEKYLEVFRSLFEKTKHIAHYDMMMKTNKEDSSNG